MNLGIIADHLIPIAGGIMLIFLFTGKIKPRKGKEEFIKKYKTVFLLIAAFLIVYNIADLLFYKFLHQAADTVQAVGNPD